MPEQAYAGDISAREAWDILASDADATLVDCRTTAEWSFVGIAMIFFAGLLVVRRS